MCRSRKKNNVFRSLPDGTRSVPATLNGIAFNGKPKVSVFWSLACACGSPLNEVCSIICPWVRNFCRLGPASDASAGPPCLLENRPCQAVKY